MATDKQAWYCSILHHPSYRHGYDLGSHHHKCICLVSCAYRQKGVNSLLWYMKLMPLWLSAVDIYVGFDITPWWKGKSLCAGVFLWRLKKLIGPWCHLVTLVEADRKQVYFKPDSMRSWKAFMNKKWVFEYISSDVSEKGIIIALKARR